MGADEQAELSEAFAALMERLDEQARGVPVTEVPGKALEDYNVPIVSTFEVFLKIDDLAGDVELENQDVFHDAVETVEVISAI